MAGTMKIRPKRFRKALDSSIDPGIEKLKICLPGCIFQDIWCRRSRGRKRESGSDCMGSLPLMPSTRLEHPSKVMVPERIKTKSA